MIKIYNLKLDLVTENLLAWLDGYFIRIKVEFTLTNSIILHLTIIIAKTTIFFVPLN